MWFHVQQKSHHEMRLPERDDLLCVLCLSINQQISMETRK